MIILRDNLCICPHCNETQLDLVQDYCVPDTKGPDGWTYRKIPENSICDTCDEEFWVTPIDGWARFKVTKEDPE